MSDSSTTVTAPPSVDRAALLARYTDVRRVTERLCVPLTVEDHVVQAMPDVSPTKWHLAHVSWFFETFLLVPHLPGYRPAHPAYPLPRHDVGQLAEGEHADRLADP